jgi:methenyltetrahydrofolate cyclohydrolase
LKIDDLQLKDLLASIAAKTPSPGGGAVAASSLALAAALAQMVVNYSLGKKSLSEHEPLHERALAHLQKVAARALELADEDAQAYARLNEIWKLDRADPRRGRDLPLAVLGAIEPPRKSLEGALELLRLLKELCSRTNPHLNSDLAVAAILAEAAARAAAWNVHVNVVQLSDSGEREAIASSVHARLSEAMAICKHIEVHCRAGA